MPFQGNIGIYVISGVFMLIGLLVGRQLKSRMKKYSQIPTRSGLSGREVAERMLEENGIYDVKVISVKGFLTDHYNPVSKTVNLSQAVYDQSSITAMAVSAHEVGHAVQHATGYSMLQLRSKLVPAVKIGGMMGQFVILAGVALVETFPQLLLAGIVLFGLTTLFSLVTLPVEFDASRRALVWMESNQMAVEQEYSYAKDGLKWAAMTYVVAAAQSVATLLYYVMIYMNRRR